MTAVKFEGVVKNYGRTQALDGLSFTANTGSVTAIIGPNGAGKTTALKAIAGLVSTSGTLEIMERDAGQWREKELKKVLFFVPEEKNFPESMKVGALCRELVQLSKDGIGVTAERLNHFNKVFMLDRKLDTAIRDLSLGMRSALYVAISLASNTSLLLLDEPLSGLDPIVRTRLIDLLKEQAIDGRCVIYSSHILEEIESVADTVVIMNRGRTLFSGAIDEAKERFSEILLERKEKEETIRGKEGVLYIRRKSDEVTAVLVDNTLYRDTLKGKRYSLNLKEIFHYLIEKDDRGEER